MAKRKPAPTHGAPCPYCGKPSAFYATSTLIWRQDFGAIYACLPCDAWVGCHKGTIKAKGRLANATLRNLKKRAHEAFDPIWRGGMMSRGAAYAWLSDHMGLDGADCHIGMMDEDQCLLVETIALWWRDGRRAPQARAQGG